MIPAIIKKMLPPNTLLLLTALLPVKKIAIRITAPRTTIIKPKFFSKPFIRMLFFNYYILDYKLKQYFVIKEII